MTPRTYPLGIDLGATRIRVAEVERGAAGPFLRQVAAAEIDPQRSTPAEIAVRLRALLTERSIVERRCIAGLGEPDAQLHGVAFPPMTARERDRAARFEAARFIDYPAAEAVVRVAPVPGTNRLHALGVTRVARLERLVAILRAADLRPTVVDHESLAFARTFPYAHVVLDIGRTCARLYAFGGTTPIGMTIPGGSHGFTTAIAQALHIDEASAERRKRAIGFSGAAGAELGAFAQAVGRALLSARNRGLTDAQRIVLCGNGARLAGLAERLERDTGCSVDVAGDLGIPQSAYPEDIARASAPDFALAVGLARRSFPEASSR